MTFQVREYQSHMISEARSRIADGHRSILLVLPTGGGKTIIASQIIHGAQAKGKRILFLAHRAELVQQCSAKLDALDVEHGIIMADHWRNRPFAAVQVASVQTLINRSIEPPDIVFVDEAHRARAETYQKILERYPRAIVIGLTATPIRTDGRGLGELFQSMVQGPTVAQLVEDGFLVPTKVFAPGRPHLKGIRRVAGDYNKRDLAAAMDRPSITGDIVEHWRKLASDRLTVVFCSGVEHSQHVAAEFARAGVPVAHLDGEMDARDRARILGDLADGRIRVLCSVGVLTEGWDCPQVSCAVLARPTMSTGLYLQMAGRVLRPAPHKVDALILDHAGCTIQHGFVEEDRQWSLSMDERGGGGGRIDLNVGIPRVCPECYMVASRVTKLCKRCGYKFATMDRAPVQVAGSLEEVGEGRAGTYAAIPADRRKTLFFRWSLEQYERGYAPGYALAKYRGCFKTDPDPQWVKVAHASVGMMGGSNATA